MKRRLNALFSVLLVAVMFVSLIPFSVSAEVTATKVTTLETGNYVITATHEGTTYAMTERDGKQCGTKQVTVSSNTISNVTNDIVATLTAVSGKTNTYTITINGVNVGHGGANKTDLSNNATEWVVTATADGFRFSTTAQPNRVLGLDKETPSRIKYYSTSTNNYVFDLVLYKVSGTVAAPTITYGNISNALSVEVGEKIGIQSGVVIFTDYNNAVIYDGTAGINLYSVGHSLSVGDEIKVSGTRADHHGLQQLKNITVDESLSVGKAITYNTTTISAILADTAGAIESTPVKLSNVKITNINSEGTITITDGTNSINIYKAPTLTGIDAGDTINVNKAVVGDFDGYQLRVSNASDIEFVSDGAATPVEYVSITEARAAAANAIVYTEGVIIFIDGRNVIIYDGTAGINVYLPAVDDTLTVGDKVKVKGARGAYNGLEQLGSAEIVQNVSSGNAITYNASTIAAILADTTGAVESTPIKLENVVIGEIKTSGNTVITDANGNSINIYKIPELTGIQEGDTVTIKVIVSDFNGYQLRVVNASDVTFVSGGNSQGGGNAGGGSAQTGDATLAFAGIAVLAAITVAGVHFTKKRTLAE